MCGVLMPTGHCVGCRCFQPIAPSTITFTTPYVPKHRKLGPAQ